MNPTQFYISVAVMPVTTIIIVLIGVLLNNNTVNRRIDDLRADLKDLLRAHDEKHEAALRRVEDMLLGKFAELDSRLSRIEAHLNLR